MQQRKPRGCSFASCVVLWTVGPAAYGVALRALSGAKRLECAELAPAFGAATFNYSACKLSALQALRVTPLPVVLYHRAHRSAMKAPPCLRRILPATPPFFW
jgi:hypothetical protein